MGVGFREAGEELRGIGALDPQVGVGVVGVVVDGDDEVLGCVGKEMSVKTFEAS